MLRRVRDALVTGADARRGSLRRGDEGYAAVAVGRPGLGIDGGSQRLRGDRRERDDRRADACDDRPHGRQGPWRSSGGVPAADLTLDAIGVDERRRPRRRSANGRRRSRSTRGRAPSPPRPRRRGRQARADEAGHGQGLQADPGRPGEGGQGATEATPPQARLSVGASGRRTPQAPLRRRAGPAGDPFTRQLSQVGSIAGDGRLRRRTRPAVRPPRSGC
jgi:hypothetical protein